MQKAREIRRAESYYPNGDVVRIGDTWGTHSLNKTTFRPGPYQTENAWGFFPLVSQNRTYACMALFPQKDSHHHQDDLAMVLWGSGRELMPDYGYNKAFYRNFSVNREGHNGSDVRWRGEPRLDAEALELKTAAESDKAARGPHVYPKRDIVFERQESYDSDVDFETLIRERTAKFASYSEGQPWKGFAVSRRVAMFDYVPEGLIAYADAASPGPIKNGVSARNRLLMLIPIHETASYVVDIHRLAGGDMHQVGVQAPFGETVTPHLQAAPADSVRAQASIDEWDLPSKSIFHYQSSYDGSQAFDLSWEAETSQVWMKVHSPGTEGALLLSGESPDQTRDPFHKIWDRPKDAPAVPHRPHVFVRRESPAQNASAQLSSMIPLIYEHGRLAETNTDRITGVERLDLASDGVETMPAHLAALALRITFASGRVDLLYTSQDQVERSIGDYTFKGRGVWLSFNQSETTDQPWAGLCMRASSVRRGDGDFQLSASLQQAEVLSADYHDGEEGWFGIFQVRGPLVDPAKYVGKWGRVDYGNDVSYVYAIRNIHPTDDPQIWTVEVEGRPGIEKRDGLWANNGYPFAIASERAVFQFNGTANVFSPEFLKSVGEKARVQADPIGLTADNATSTAATWGSLDATLTDPFAYNINNPKSSLPENADTDFMYGASLNNGVDALLNYTLSGGTYTVAAGGESLIIDVYGRKFAVDRDNNFDIVLYNGNYSTSVATVTGLGIDDTTFHTRGTIELAEGVQFDRIQIIGHDSDTSAKNYFTIAELKVSRTTP